MNRRQWKKACKKAAERCAREFPGEFVFEPATGTETVYAPVGYSPKWITSQVDRHYASPPRGTPIYWERVGYYEPEWDCHTALDAYNARRAMEDFDWEEEIKRLDAETAAA